MTTSYLGTSDVFHSAIDLMNDSDAPRAFVFREPLADLIDNCVYLKRRTIALETPGVVGLTATTNTTASRTLVSKTLFPGTANGQPTAGTSYKFFAAIVANRGATATACTIFLTFRINGAQFDAAFGAVLNTTNGFSGAAQIEGVVTFHADPGAAVPVTVALQTRNSLVSSTLVSTINVPDLAQTRDTTVPIVLSVTAEMSAAVPGVSFTPVAGSIQQFAL